MLRVQPEGREESTRGRRLSSGMRIGPYEITDFIGAGGMGEVYHARDTNLDRIVALKLLPLDLATEPERLSRFEQEARAVSSLNHPAIVTIYDAGQIGSQPYISMEFVAGDTLRELLAAGALPLRRALRIGSQLSDGLAKAHEAGLVHRDLKPENVKISSDGFAKILDFGLAKRVAATMSDQVLANARTAIETSPGMVVGTIGYMAPEQATGAAIDFRADQFSFGAVLYEMLTGVRAFERPTLPETLAAIIREEPRRLAQLNPGIPPPVRWIVERCLAKDPRERYALTRDLARDLASAREHLSELVVAQRGPSSRRAASHRAIAVLPVVNLSGDSQQEPLADAMTDTLLAELTQYRDLHVVSRMASMPFKTRPISVSDLAEELDVKWVLLASFLRSGQEVRISAQLVDASCDENRWAQSYTKTFRKILTMQNEVARAIAAAVNTVVTFDHSTLATAV